MIVGAAFDETAKASDIRRYLLIAKAPEPMNGLLIEQHRLARQSGPC